MRDLIQTDEDRSRIIAMARAWDGTPYVADGAIKGAGCSCSSLPWAVLKEFGHTAPEIPRRMGLHKVEIHPLMLSWLNEHPEHYRKIELKWYDEADRKRVCISCFQPGDLLIINLGIGHALLAVDKGEAMHSWQNGGCHAGQISSLETRLTGAWRPVVP